jgi:hypothetical protein
MACSLFASTAVKKQYPVLDARASRYRSCIISCLFHDRTLKRRGVSEPENRVQHLDGRHSPQLAGKIPAGKRKSPVGETSIIKKDEFLKEIPPSCSDKSTSIQYTGIVQGTNHDDLPRVVLAMIYVWIAQFAQPSTRS